MPEFDRKFDVRTISRFVREGIVDRKDYEAHLEQLPDVADKAAPMESEFVAGVLDDEPESADETEETDADEDDEESSE